MSGLAQSCAAHVSVHAETQVHALVDRFVASVNAADTATFLSFFSEDATAFFPTNAARKIGIQQIREAIAPAFAQGPRNPAVRANDLVVTVNDDLAVASFDAGIGAAHARRTLVLRRMDGGWKIIHLHASNLTEQK
jgi:uncharacterized protein (TIGR02246 family)